MCMYIYIYIYLCIGAGRRRGRGPSRARRWRSSRIYWDHTNPPHPHHPLFNKYVLLCKSSQGPYLINVWGGGGVGLCGPQYNRTHDN